jgi:hypothetical protein
MDKDAAESQAGEERGGREVEGKVQSGVRLELSKRCKSRRKLGGEHGCHAGRR